MTIPDLIVLLRRWMSPEPAFAASPQDRERIAKVTGVGRHHLMAARATVDQRLFAPAATLYGHAIASFLQARRVLTDAQAAAKGKVGSPPESVAAAPATPADFIAASPFGPTEAGRDALRLLQELPADGAPSNARSRRALAGLDRLAAGLGTEFYPASESDVRGLRMRRRIVAVLALFVAIALLGRWLTAPRNVARGKRVTASSVRFGAPQALVNGAIEWGTFGLHTGSGRAWATIDLGDFYTLAFADIYGRGDGHLEHNLPLSVDLSDDGIAFRPAGACTDIFTQASPCVVSLAHQRARFVRVSASEVVLSEVEVYAEP
jgi:hypothetical protein